MQLIVKESNINGRGSFAVDDIQAGEHILFFEGDEVSLEELNRRIAAGIAREDDDIQMNENLFLSIFKKSPTYFVNHSCDPNAGIRGQKELFALRMIRKGEEITFDYSTTYDENCDPENAWSMPCRCGSEKCRKEIGGIGTIPYEAIKRYAALGAIPDFLKIKLVSSHDVSF